MAGQEEEEDDEDEDKMDDSTPASVDSVPIDDEFATYAVVQKPKRRPADMAVEETGDLPKVRQVHRKPSWVEIRPATPPNEPIYSDVHLDD